MSGAHVVFVATEDWFFASHFLPMGRATLAAGHRVSVVVRVRQHRAAIEAAGARVVPFEAERSSLNPLTAGDAAGRLARILGALEPDLVHCIALRGILIGGAAAALARIPRRVYALTGLGLLGARDDIVGRLARKGLSAAIRGPLETKRTHYLVENPDDARSIGLDPADPRVTLVGGAGVDPEAFAPRPLPSLPGLKVALVARMLWSKGIDTAVEAVRLARSHGADVGLTLVGAPDPSNRRAIPEATLRGYEGDGTAWIGPAQDIAGTMAAHHVVCLPSRGGEGLPRSLLEGAASGRALLATDVPGCRTLVRDGIEGLLVPPGDPKALAAAIERLAGDPGLVARLGAAARTRILDGGYTEAAVGETVARLHARMLAP